MAEDLPEPASRKEEYLAKAAGMDVDELPEPASREEQYLNAIAEGGGGGGGTSNFNQLSNRPKYNNTTMTGDTNIPEVKTYSDFIGTDGTAAGAAGLVPAPATTDAGKFLKADGTWDTAGGGGGDTVYSNKTTSNSSIGGAVYIGNLDDNQDEQSDPTTTDNHYKYFWALPYANSSLPTDYSINIMGSNSSTYSTVIGREANAPSIGSYGTAIGYGATVRAQYSTALGTAAYIDNNISHSVALGDRAYPTRAGEVNIGNSINQGYNSTAYRVIGGVHDGIDAHDAVTVGQLNTRMGGMTILSITQAAYDALATKDPNTLYVITGA